MDNKELFKAVAAFQADSPSIKLDGKVDYVDRKGNRTNFKFATLGNVIESISPQMKKCKLGFTQLVSEGALKTILFHESGQSITSEYPLPQVNTPQDLGKWMTYIKRYQLCSILGIVGEEDTDGGSNNPPSKVHKKIQSIPAEVTAKVSMALEEATTKELFNQAWAKCKEERKKYPQMAQLFEKKKLQLQNG